MTSEQLVRRVARIEELEHRPRIVTIGTFDGVHMGHQRLLASTRNHARRATASSLAVTFEPIPSSVLRPDQFAGRISSMEDKLRMLQQSGLDEVLTITFDLEFSHQTAEEFMSDMVRKAGLTELWVGEAFALGRGRSGNVARLEAIGGELGFIVRAIPRVTIDDTVVSSSAIRTAIMAGEVGTARRMLGRPFRISGEVIHGAHLGRTIGYPTANMLPPAEIVPLGDGIYASLALLRDGHRLLPAMTYVGTRPTVNTGARVVETHILDFEGDLYGQTLTVDLMARLRADQTFSGMDDLIAQLNRDEAAARNVLRSEALILEE